MDFVDRMLVRLAAEDTRGDVLSSDALREVIAAAYGLDLMPVSGPYSAHFDDFMLGYAASPVATLDGGWGAVGGADRTEAQLRVSGLGPDAGRIDALWRGAVVGLAAAAADRVESVASDWPDRGSDGEYRGSVDVTFSEPASGPGTPTALPVAVALLVRDIGFSLADLLARSHALRQRLRPLGLERPVDPALKLRNPIVVGWLIPVEVFDDADWPGAGGGTPAEQREARRAAAAVWLARDGIALLTAASSG